jgi:hypothetical protein
VAFGAIFIMVGSYLNLNKLPGEGVFLESSKKLSLEKASRKL